VLTVLLVAAGQREQDHRPLYALMISLGFVGFLVACAVGFAHLQRLKVMRGQLPPGLEMTTQFGPDFMVLRRPWSEATLHFDGYAGLEILHGWVFLRRRDSKTAVMVPEQLFPAHDLARLRLVIAGYQPRRPGADGVPDAEPGDEPPDGSGGRDKETGIDPDDRPDDPGIGSSI
jgi:hypothetical protein